jgi:hypothetical protein
MSDKINKKDSYYFPHDYNARTDRKMVKLKLKHNVAGIGVYWCVVEMLYEDGGKIPLSEISTIAQDIIADEILVTSVVNDFDLFKNDGICFWSESVNRRLAYRLEKSEKARISAEIRWNNANAMRTHSDGNAIKENKEEESKEREAPALPINFKKMTEKQFYESIAQFKEQFPKEILRGFYEYWIEPSATGIMRFQLEKTWGIHRRLKTWQSREKEFDSKGKNNFSNSTQTQTAAPLKQAM